jgi:cytoskeleton protein RodZ
MPEIGVTLREARMRAGIDIAEVESRTKIRAKYLRALENEEWSLLPGTTFVKSFLRTYAEALGLDAKLLVEEYKFRHEPYEVGANGQSAGSPRGRRGGRRGGSRGGAFGPQKRTNLLPILLLLVVVAGAIFAVLQLGKSEDKPPPTTTTQPRAKEQRASDIAAAEATRQKRLVRLRIVAPSRESASVCVFDASGKKVLDQPELAAGKRTKVVKSRSFEIVTTDGAKVLDTGKRIKLKADSKNVIAYRVTKKGRVRLPSAKRPSCS